MPDQPRLPGTIRLGLWPSMADSEGRNPSQETSLTLTEITTLSSSHTQAESHTQMESQLLANQKKCESIDSAAILLNHFFHEVSLPTKIASNHSFKEPVKLLEQAIDNLNLKLAEDLVDTYPEIVNQEDEAGHLPLYKAIKTGQKALVSLLLDEGANTENIDHSGMSALALAIRENHSNLVETLLDEDVDPTARDASGDSPLTLAIKAENPKIISILLEHGVDPDDDADAIFWAEQGGNEHVMRLLGMLPPDTLPPVPPPNTKQTESLDKEETSFSTYVLKNIFFDKNNIANLNINKTTMVEMLQWGELDIQDNHVNALLTTGLSDCTAVTVITDKKILFTHLVGSNPEYFNQDFLSELKARSPEELSDAKCILYSPAIMRKETFKYDDKSPLEDEHFIVEHIGEKLAECGVQKNKIKGLYDQGGQPNFAVVASQKGEILFGEVSPSIANRHFGLT